MKTCHQCGTDLPDEANFCFNCGAPQSETQAVDVNYTIDFDEDLEKQIRDYFFNALKNRPKEEYLIEDFTPFTERLYESGFRDELQGQLAFLAEELERMNIIEPASPGRVDAFLAWQFTNLLDFYIIRYCQDLVPIQLPESILNWQTQKWDTLDIFQMVLDYLDFAHEPETVYTDFLNMPIEKLKNASKSFLFPQKHERLLLFCDQSLFGSGKEGFALTDEVIYWKAHLEKPRKIAFDSLEEIVMHKEWITINTFFFNVSPSVNLKVLKLLKRIQVLLRLV